MPEIDKEPVEFFGARVPRNFDPRCSIDPPAGSPGYRQDISYLDPADRENYIAYRRILAQHCNGFGHS